MKKNIPEASRFSFTSGVNHLTFQTAVITGTCRSGKTLLGNLLATANFVEHADEPWLPMNLPVAVGLKMVDKKLAKDMFVTYTTELFNDMVLLRHANFRSKDMSSIWKQKTPKEIFFRLKGLETRLDVKNFAAQHNPLLLYNLAEAIPYIKFITFALPSCKIIHSVREGFQVAQDVAAKHWFSDKQLLFPINAQIYRKYKYKTKIWYLPWWVSNNDEGKFINFSELERALYYWCSLIEKSIDIIDSLVTKGRCLTVRYEDLVKNPSKTLNATLRYLSIKKTPLTEKALKKVFICKRSFDYSSDISAKLYQRACRLCQRLGYKR